ncbi:hypothetical protein STRTUCAR8_06892 [Streptomyces turgidiscabies Car8]|uniref:Uncharacterized protein n=1 Tax=Streptomyces turgidiscabies (strain Car8) TaxID=698760 RepID=L7ERH9_STRT8|nr:hypothetical protein STRTUCAR8_06892 [Streptomyces turgidiscabies Car8]
MRPLPAEEAEHDQPAHQHRDSQRAPPRRRTRHTQYGNGQGCWPVQEGKLSRAAIRRRTSWISEEQDEEAPILARPSRGRASPP